jgi:hypothetical protein
MFGYGSTVKPDQVPFADFISGKLPRFALQKRATAQGIRTPLRPAQTSEIADFTIQMRCRRTAAKRTRMRVAWRALMLQCGRRRCVTTCPVAKFAKTELRSISSGAVAAVALRWSKQKLGR